MTTFLKQKGGYKKLRVYQVSVIIYDITFYFVQHFLKKGDRTIDQMLQAARSGKQNIAEGSQAATTSAETEIKLTNVAKASLEELLLDYEDYLRVRNKVQWKRGILVLKKFVLLPVVKRSLGSILLYSLNVMMKHWQTSVSLSSNKQLICLDI